MKVRTCFVSNSSSSSFVCSVCGRQEIVYDSSVDEARMFTCEHEHVVCTVHAVNTNEPAVADDWFGNKETCDNFSDALSKRESSVPAIYCPICQLEQVTDSDMAAYMIKRSAVNRCDIVDEIREKFGTHANFKKFLSSQ